MDKAMKDSGMGNEGMHLDRCKIKNSDQPAPRAKNMPSAATTGECAFNSFPSNGMLPVGTDADIAK